MKSAANDILDSTTNKLNQFKATRKQHAVSKSKSRRARTIHLSEAEGDWNTGECVHSIHHDLRNLHKINLSLLWARKIRYRCLGKCAVTLSWGHKAQYLILSVIFVFLRGPLLTIAHSLNNPVSDYGANNALQNQSRKGKDNFHYLSSPPNRHFKWDVAIRGFNKLIETCLPW